MAKHFIFIIILSHFIISCNNQNDAKFNNNDIRPPEEIYKSAKIKFDNENFDESYLEFSELKRLYPLSNEAIESEIMIGFIAYVKMDYESAIIQFEKFVNKYPAHQNLDYVYYMRAMCNYEQISHHGLDGMYNEISLKQFNEVIKRFPKSDYARDSQQKIIFINSNKAAKHMDIGRFYLKEKKYTAALNRFKIIIENYSETKFTPEALHRMVETYYEMGMLDESIKTASTLGHNYPNSKWYKYSYNLIKKNKKKENLFKKFTNIF